MTGLEDAILRLALELQGLSAHEEARAEAILRLLEDDLRQLIASRNLTDAGKRDIDAIIKAAEDAISARYASIAGTLDMQGLVVMVAERTVEAMRAAYPALDMTKPTAETLASLSRNVLIEGAPTKDWWAKQDEDTAFKFAQQVRQGVVNGETNERIVQRVVGRAGEPGVLDVSRRNARTLVHSSIMSAANTARWETYKTNFADASPGVKWLATLDSHTCPTCGALDGQKWDWDRKPIQGSDMLFTMPPRHANCRCILTPLPPSFDDIFGKSGLDDMLAGIGGRASSQGPQKSGTTFADFLKRQSPEFVERTLGKRRAELYRAGKITLSDLVTKTGRPLTLDELKAGG